MLNKNWFKGVAQATVYTEKGATIKINAPRGFVEMIDDEGLAYAEWMQAEVWRSAIRECEGESFTSIRKLETVYLFADGLCKWRTIEDKAGVAMSSACANIREYVVKCETAGLELNRNELRPLLMAWITSVYSESSLDLDASAVNVTGKRADDFIKLIGKSSAKNRVPKSGRMVSGNRTTVTKAGSAFMKALCQWTVDVTQMKYIPVTTLTVA